MSEKEKMLAGELYNAEKDNELFQERLLCKTLCQKYNNLPISEIEKRKNLLKQILGKTKENFWIE